MEGGRRREKWFSLQETSRNHPGPSVLPHFPHYTPATPLGSLTYSNPSASSPWSSAPPSPSRDSLLNGLPAPTLSSLKYILHGAARVIFENHKSASISPAPTVLYVICPTPPPPWFLPSLFCYHLLNPATFTSFLSFVNPIMSLLWASPLAVPSDWIALPSAPAVAVSSSSFKPQTVHSQMGFSAHLGWPRSSSLFYITCHHLKLSYRFFIFFLA